MNEILQNMYEILKPILPVKFDQNEYFTIFITLLITSWYIYLHKRKPTLLNTEVMAILLFNLLYTTVGDYFLAMKPYDFYDTVDHNSGELMDILLQNIVYPGTLLILMHYYAQYRPNLWIYTLIGVSLLYVLEWIGVEYFHLFTYKSWKWWYSVLFYCPVMVLNIIYYEKLHKYVQRQISVNANKTHP